jgi:hypothetical protein
MSARARQHRETTRQANTERPSHAGRSLTSAPKPHQPECKSMDQQTEWTRIQGDGRIYFLSHLYSCVQGGVKQTFVCLRGCDRSR